LPKKIEFDLLLADLALQFGNAPANGTRHHSRSLRRTLGRRQTHRLASAWPTAATQRLSPTGSVTIPPNVEVLAQNLRFLRYHAPHCPEAWWHLHLLRAGQGQGWQRNIVMSGSPHLPSDIRQWFGDSRGHWEGETLVIDVTNFGPKTDFQGARENLHLVERWTRTGPISLDYSVTVEDTTVWTRPWTVKQGFTRQSDQENKVYYEPRCLEGNFGLPGLLHGRRLEELAFAAKRGPDPATRDNTHGSFVLEADPLR
jgi:hypothetical protein